MIAHVVIIFIILIIHYHLLLLSSLFLFHWGTSIIPSIIIDIDSRKLRYFSRNILLAHTALRLRWTINGLEDIFCRTLPFRRSPMHLFRFCLFYEHRRSWSICYQLFIASVFLWGCWSYRCFGFLQLWGLVWHVLRDSFFHRDMVRFINLLPHLVYSVYLLHVLSVVI